MDFKKAGISLLWIFVCTSMHGLEFTVDKAVQTALENNVSLHRSELSLKGLERIKNHAWNSISPSVSVTGTGTMLNSASTDETGGAYRSSFAGQLDTSVSVSLSVFSEIDAARRNYETGTITYENARRSVEASVRIMFYNILYQIEYRALQQRNLESARVQYEMNLAKYNEGRISELDVLSSRISYEKLKPVYESAVVAEKNLYASFRQILGVKIDEAVELSGSLPETAASVPAALSACTSEQSGDVKQLEKSLAAAESTLVAAQSAAFLPTLKFGWSYNPSRTENSSAWSDKGAAYASLLWTPDSFLPFSAAADKIASARDAADDARLQLADTRTTVENNCRSYQMLISQLRTAVASDNENKKLAEKNYSMMKKAYADGYKDLLSLRDASDQLLSTEVSLLSDEYALIAAVINLEKESGVPFGTYSEVSK